MIGKVLLLTCLAGAALAAFQPDFVTNLPGCPEYNFKMYSGFLNITETKNLHYLLVESQSNPKKDPLVLWLNGGPGCSSLLGFMQEHGPCVIDDGETAPKNNDYPWNLKANVLYLEAPAGVGFSYGASRDDERFNDMTTSEDNLKAMLMFFEKYPEFLNNDLFLSGESYAGIYIPYLSWQIYQHNLQADFKPLQKLNMKGFIIVNGATDWDVDITPSFLPMAYWHNLMDTELHETFEKYKCEWFFRDVKTKDNPPECDKAMKRFNELTSRINWYDIYRKVYDNGIGNSSRLGFTTLNGKLTTYKRGYTMKEYTPWLPVSEENNAVLGDGISDYFNRPDVRENLHVEDSKVNKAWAPCANIDYHLQTEASFWIYHVLKNQYRILFMSGNTDGAVPTYGTLQWIEKLQWKVKEEWRAWLVDNQVGGFVKKYDGIEFATVHGVGHMAPQWKRKPVTTMFTNWIHGKDF